MLLGVACELPGALRSTKLGLEIRVGIVLGRVCLFLLPTMALGAPMSFFICSRCFLGLVLGSQTDTPTLENVDLIMEILTFLKISCFFLPKMALRAFWGFPRGSWKQEGSCSSYLFSDQSST